MELSLLLISYLKLQGDQKLINFASQLCFRGGGMREEHWMIMHSNGDQAGCAFYQCITTNSINRDFP